MEFKGIDTDDKLVNHPNHYLSNGLEVIDILKAFTEDLTGIEAICTGNILKYICRWNKKNGLQDLEKAQWYLSYLINLIKEKKDEKME